MLINNHFSYNIMGVENKLGKEFLSQDFSDEKLYSETIESCKNTAFNYARIENSIAVLSDIQSNRSYIYYGGLSRVLGIKGTGSSAEVHSIWEEEIFRLIHPDDLAENICRNSDFSISSNISRSRNARNIILPSSSG